MNLFTQYGIKEVADVTLYSIIEIGDEDFYIPILYLDTLKISSVDKKSSKANASGGYGNHRLMSWEYGKDITVKLQDALFTPASMSLAWGGWLNQGFTKFTYAIAKLSVANKYARLHYSPYAYKSPELTDEEWEVIFFAKERTLSGNKEPMYWTPLYKKDKAQIEENRVNLKKQYFSREGGAAIDKSVITKIIELVQDYSRFSNYSTNLYDVEVIDRFEKCRVEGDSFAINVEDQKNNLIKYLMDDQSSTYTIYYDDKTFAPLGLNQLNKDSNGNIIENLLLRRGTTYLKWTRYVKPKNSVDKGVLGKQIVINTDTFPGYIRLVGETHIREQKTGKDQCYQLIIPKAKVNSDTSLTLETAGEPTVFDLSLDVIAQPDDMLMYLRQFDVEADCVNGGTRVVPQSSDFTKTYTELETVTKPDDIIIKEIY